MTTIALQCPRIAVWLGPVPIRIRPPPTIAISVPVLVVGRWSAPAIRITATEPERWAHRRWAWQPWWASCWAPVSICSVKDENIEGVPQLFLFVLSMHPPSFSFVLLLLTLWLLWHFHRFLPPPFTSLTRSTRRAAPESGNKWNPTIHNLNEIL